MQADFAEQAVHQKRRPCEVAAVFQDGQEEKQQRDLRQKCQHRADAGDDALRDEILQRAILHAPSW